MSTLHIVPYIKDKQVIHIELKTDLRSPDFVLLVTPSERSGTVLVEAENSFVREEFLSSHYRHALGRTVDNQTIFDSDYYLNTMIPECAMGASHFGTKTEKVEQLVEQLKEKEAN